MATTNDSAHPNPVIAPQATIDLLKRLHVQSEEQEANIRLPDKNIGFGTNEVTVGDFKTIMSDKFIALDEDKCQFMYQLIRATGAKNIVEVGSQGVVTCGD